MHPVQPSKTRSPFRIAAYCLAIFCFLCAAITGFSPIDNRLVVVGIFLFVGFVMLTIGKTGNWPPKKA